MSEQARPDPSATGPNDTVDVAPESVGSKNQSAIPVLIKVAPTAMLAHITPDQVRLRLNASSDGLVL